MNKQQHDELKVKYRGVYKRANEKIIPRVLYKILNYNEMIKNVDKFNNFDNFLKFYLHSNKKIKYYIGNMVKDLNDIGIKATEETALELLTVRLGNVYFGISMENEILNKLKNLSKHIVCMKSSDVEDMEYKIDATLEIIGVNKIAIQIKPITYNNYSSRSEGTFHQQYFLNFNNKVVYFFYDNEYNLIILNEKINLNDSKKLISIIEKIILN